MDVRAAHSAGIDLDIDVAIFELLWLELQRCSVIVATAAIHVISTHFLLLELSPFLLIFDHETFESIWITHCDGDVGFEVFALFYSVLLQYTVLIKEMRVGCR